MAALILRRLHFLFVVSLGVSGLCAEGDAVAGVVGTGTAASCTESALATQIAAGGTVTFNCGGTATIAMTSGIAIGSSSPALVVNGGGLITLDGSSISPHQPMISIFGGSSALPSITFTGMTFSNGNATGTGLQAGGAILNEGNLTLDQDIFINNQAPFGGAIVQQRCSSAGSPPAACVAASLTVTNSQFSGNNASNSGGAINLQSDTVSVSNSTFSGNSAGSGGAIYLFGNSTFTTSGIVTTSTFSGNSATSDGGAIAVVNLQGGSATITNNTFNANQATGPNAAGGAIWIGSPTTLTNDTIAGNSAPGGGGIDNASTLTMQDTLLAGNTGGNCAGSSFSGANNLQFGDSSCSGVTVADPRLGALANNGGPTQTMALLAGSAAIDAGSNGTCALVDQRGIARPQGANCDIGAFEAQAVVIVPARPTSAPASSRLMLLFLGGLFAALGLSARRRRG